MGTAADWKNVEVTLYAKVNDVDFSGERPQLALAARGGPHDWVWWIFGNPCRGTAYYAVLKVEGMSAFAKELFHDGGYADDIQNSKDAGTGTLQKLGGLPDLHRWIGMKGIFYNNMDGNPRIELWIDKKGDNDWRDEPVDCIEDITWSLPEGVENKSKGGNAEKIIWGGPEVIFRWDHLLDIDIKWASVREIVPPVMSLRNLLESKEISFPANIKSIAEDYGLVTPISARDLAQRLL